MSFNLVLFYNFLFIFILQLLFFVVAYVFRTDKFTDLVYALSFVVISFVNYLIFSYGYISSLIIFVCILIWGLRLGIYLFIRIVKIGKDRRFDDIRNNFFVLAKFWIGQTVAIWFISLSVLIHYFYSGSNDISLLFVLGIIIFLLGLYVEAVSDYQKFVFKLKYPDMWIDSGFFSLIRHPNYLGEILVWIGIWVSVSGYPNGLRGILSPLFIIVLLLFVSGIPPLENQRNKKYFGNKKWLKYKKNTKKLIPYIY